MKISEWLVEGDGAGEREPSTAEVQHALASDPDGALIADYLTRSLPADARAAFERRLRDDDAFRSRVETIRAAWDAWPTAGDFTRSDEERAASYERFLVKWEARQGDDTSLDDARVATAGGARDTGSDATSRLHLRQLRELRRWQLVAGFLGVLLLGGVPLAAWTGFTTAQRLQPPQPPRTYSVEATARESKVVDVGLNASVSLDPGSRLTWSEAPGPNGAHELFLDGAAQIHAPMAAVGKFVMITPTAHLILNGAVARVDASDPALSRIAVEQGTIVVASRSRTNFELLPLGAGETGIVLYNQPPRIVR